MLVLSQQKDFIADVNYVRACPEGYANAACVGFDERASVCGVSTQTDDSIVCLGQYESVKRCQEIIHDMAAAFNQSNRVYLMPEK